MSAVILSTARRSAPDAGVKARSRPYIDLVKMFDDGAAVHQCLTVVEEKSRDAAERITGAYFDPVAG
jgi:hypothetical protein